MALGALIIGFFAVGCGGDSDSNTLTADETKQLGATVDRLESEAGFRPIIPQHLPPKIDRIPIGQVFGTPAGPEVSLAYDFHLDPSTDVVTPKDPFLAVMTLGEWRRKASCGEVGGPTQPDALVDTATVVGDSSVREVVLKTADDTISHQLTFASGTLCIDASFHWAFPQGTPTQLPEEMRREGLRVVESMLSGG